VTAAAGAAVATAAKAAAARADISCMTSLISLQLAALGNGTARAATATEWRPALLVSFHTVVFCGDMCGTQSTYI